MAGRKGRALAGAEKYWVAFLIFGILLGSYSVALGADRQQPSPSVVRTFLEIELLNPACWRYVTAFGIVEYENICSGDSKVSVVKSDGKPATYLISPHGKLVFVGGNAVHIFGKVKEAGK